LASMAQKIEIDAAKSRIAEVPQNEVGAPVW
jgi:hypothetical protein